MTSRTQQNIRMDNSRGIQRDCSRQMPRGNRDNRATEVVGKEES